MWGGWLQWYRRTSKKISVLGGNFPKNSNYSAHQGGDVTLIAKHIAEVIYVNSSILFFISSYVWPTHYFWYSLNEKLSLYLMGITCVYGISHMVFSETTLLVFRHSCWKNSWLCAWAKRPFGINQNFKEPTFKYLTLMFWFSSFWSRTPFGYGTFVA
jgi:hypothetical protein